MVDRKKQTIVKTVTKDGEIKITLDLNISINNDGINLQVQPKNSNTPVNQIEEEDKVEWAIPDFKKDKQKIKFGKDE